MPLVTREISNTGEPLCAPDGTVLAGIEIVFTLRNPNGLFVDAWDAISYERVTGRKSVITDVNGEFIVELWPNDRGSEVTEYVCHVDSCYVRDFAASLPSGPTGLSWVQFMGGATPLPPVDLDALALHVLSPTAHPNATEFVNGFMSAADKAKLDLLPGGGSLGLAFEATAGEAIGGHRAVILDADGLAFYASQDDPTHMGSVAGVSQGAVVLNDAVSIMAKGRLIEPTWAWTPYLPIFLGLNGLLTQTPPVTGFLLVLGSALDATTMLVNPSSPIVIT